MHHPTALLPPAVSAQWDAHQTVKRHVCGMLRIVISVASIAWIQPSCGVGRLINVTPILFKFLSPALFRSTPRLRFRVSTRNTVRHRQAEPENNKDQTNKHHNIANR